MRDLLIVTGQLEQAVYDRFDIGEGKERTSKNPTKQRLLKLAAQLTDATAIGFRALWATSEPQDVVLTSLRKSAEILHALDPFGADRVSVTVPEGFAFYALFPEQYCAATQKWLADQPADGSQRVLVVGLRSIGTTLSAVVRATLLAAGWNVERITVRPTGPPFARKIRLPRPSQDFTCALVVDEGPGISGSSMAATAEWLFRGGIANITFLPGHNQNAGRSPSERTQRWWSTVPIYYSRLEEITWSGDGLKRRLADASGESCGKVKEMHDLSAGMWRAHVFGSAADWPAVCRGFERTKFLCVGARGSLLWKFSGLGRYDHRCASENAELKVERQPKLRGFVPEVLGSRLGFVATPWIEGKRLKKDDASDESILERVARYIARAANAPLEECAAREAIERLRTMLLCNVRAALGPEFEERAAQLTESTRNIESTLSYGDGRLAPHEWVRMRDGNIFKTDYFGHNSDHTLIGEQSILWDVAGAIVEWGLGKKQRNALVSFLSGHGIAVPTTALSFYIAAYIAFRIGFTSFGIGQAGDDPDEQKRLLVALSECKQVLESVLMK